MASLKRVTHKNSRIVYRIVISLGYDGQGHRRTKHFTCSVNQSASPRQQEREALKYAMDLEDRLKYGHTSVDSHMFFEEFANQWLENEKENLAVGTYVGYEQLMRKKILPYFKSYRIAHVRTPDIEAFYQMLTGEYAPGTIRRYANVLNRIFGTAKRWNLIEMNPCQNARKPKKLKETENLRYFTPRQALTFLKSLELTYEEDCGEYSETETDKNPQVSESSRRIYRVPVQYRVFYTLSLFCGFRKGETLALHWEDIDFVQREISISKAIGRTEHGFDYKEPKNRISVRKVPFPESILPLLVEYREQYDQHSEELGSSWRGSGNLFIRRDGSLMGESTAYQHFVRHLKRFNRWVALHPGQASSEGLTELPSIPLHGLRHSCATLLNYLDVNIVDISRYLGHASCSTTMNIYAHSFEEQKRAASDKLNAFIVESGRT